MSSRRLASPFTFVALTLLAASAVLSSSSVSFAAQPDARAEPDGGAVEGAEAGADLTASPAAEPSSPAPTSPASPAPSTPTASIAPTPPPLEPQPVVDPTIPPVGRAAPPTEAATRSDAPVRVGLEVFAEYMYRSTESAGAGSSTWFHAFDAPRIHGAVEGVLGDVRGRVVIEALRSATEGALLGVAGDSLVLRAREAYVAYRPTPMLEASAGVIPTLTIPELDGTWMLRPVAPSGLEASGLGSPADLGAKVRFDAPGRYGWAAVAVTNGEGYASRELNRGKNIEAALEIHPLPRGALLPLGVFASYTSGSTGTVSARADRLSSGLVWQGARVRAGALFTYAWGVAQSGTQRAALASSFLRVEPVSRLLVGARFDTWIRDSSGSNVVNTLWLSAGYRIADPLEVFLVGSRHLPTTRAQAELPGADAWSARAVARVVF